MPKKTSADDTPENQAMHAALAQNLRRLKKRHGYTHRSLAKRSGVAGMTVNRALHGQGEVTLRVVALFARTFGVEPITLLTPPEDERA